MQEIFEYLQEKLERALEFLAGVKNYEVEEVKERIPHKVPYPVIQPVSRPDAPCDRY